jgi:hypothetical protein
LGQGQIVIEGLPEFLRALKRYVPEVHKQFRERARAIAVAISAEAKQNASWSRRIPAAISPSVTTKFIGVRVSKKKAAHGGIYERGVKGNPNVVRHPLFGNRDFWFSTPTRPFIAPAVEAKRGDSLEAMLRAVEEAKRGAGLE